MFSLASLHLLITVEHSTDTHTLAPHGIRAEREAVGAGVVNEQTCRRFKVRLAVVHLVERWQLTPGSATQVSQQRRRCPSLGRPPTDSSCFRTAVVGTARRRRAPISAQGGGAVERPHKRPPLSRRRPVQSCTDCEIGDVFFSPFVRPFVSSTFFTPLGKNSATIFFLRRPDSATLRERDTTDLIRRSQPSSTQPLSTMTKSSAVASSKQSRLSKPSCSPAVAARRALLRRIQRQELRKLQLLIPSMSCRVYRREPDPCTVIDQAIRYIDQLHATVLARVQAGSLPRGEQTFIHRLEGDYRDGTLWPNAVLPARVLGQTATWSVSKTDSGRVWVTSGNGRRPLADDITAPSPCHLSLKGLDYQITFAGSHDRRSTPPSH
uniref:BHLH domain-containing protein n=1 Tax=Plectus sambesii TaxID=2011161 RepID=A0A914VUN3_9BILA